MDRLSDQELSAWNEPRFFGGVHINAKVLQNITSELIEARAELERLRAERDALPEKLIDILHVLDVEAQTIANRISGMHGVPCRHPDGVQVLEDAETIIRAAFAAMKGGTQ